MPKVKSLTITEQTELFMTDNPRVVTTHATFTEPARSIVVTIIKEGTSESEKKRLLELAHKLALSRNK